MKTELETFYGLIDDIHVAMMTTRRPDGHLESRAMANQKRAEGADLWFVTAENTGKLRDIEHSRGGLRTAEPLQACQGQQGCVSRTLLELAQAGIDIAAQRHDLQIRAQPFGERLPAQRRGAERRARRQRGQALGFMADKNVTRILALQAGGENKSGRKDRRHILGGMHRDIDPAGE